MNKEGVIKISIMAKIKDIKARQILDSRDTPTIEVEVFLEDGNSGKAAVPSGASTGEHEAFELRDENPESFGGKSVYKAIENVEKIILPNLNGQEALEQQKIDSILIQLDGTKNKSKLGANAILGVSMATAVAQANSEKIELFEYLHRFNLVHHKQYEMPFAMFNLLNGGRHAANSTDFQEYMIVPILEESFSKRLQCASEIFQALKNILQTKKLPTTVGDEGGFAPNFNTNEEPLKLLTQAIEKAGYKPYEEVVLALDIAASEFFKNGKYVFKKEGKYLDKSSLSEYLKKLCNKYPIVSIEDPLQQNDFKGWAEFVFEMKGNLQIVGDDLYTTNITRLKTGVTQKSSTAILIKPNQIGTLTETIEVINYAQENNIKTIVSHRSGETEDTFIADLAVGLNSPQVKMGSVSRSERLAKYNRLLKIEELINK